MPKTKQNNISDYASNDSFLLNTMLTATNDAIVFTDKDGFITKMSDAYATFLKRDLKDCIGKHISQIIENTRMPIVLQTGVAEIAQLHEINGEKMIATRIPMKKNGEIVGSFGRVIFKNISELDALYTSISEMKKTLTLYKDKFNTLSSARYSLDDIIGNSQSLLRLKETVQKMGGSNSNILILGESGTGKELFAHAIHNSSNRCNMPLICVNCASIPWELMESEFFGYTEGSFTGGKKGGKIGLFHAADHGTLFLDEIGDLPIHMQVKLLRALQEREIRRIGSSVSEEVDVRIITATGKNLLELVHANKFRDDLYYRLNVVNIHIPPLRERLEDLPLLVDSLLQKIGKKNQVIIEGITAAAMNKLRNYNWPGNVRELENVLERSSNFLESDRTIHRRQIILNNKDIDLSKDISSLKEYMDNAEKQFITHVIKSNKGNKSQTAKDLKISRTSLYEKLDKYGMD